MKPKLLTLTLIILIAFSINAATITIITGQGGGNTFSPQNVNVTVGDSVKWVWATGDHTTTSTTIPGGAPVWNALLDNTHQTFIYVVSVPGVYNYKCIPHESMGMIGSFTASPIGIIQISSNVPESFNLHQNYPNPFNPSTKIQFAIPQAGTGRDLFVQLKVYDVLGNEVVTLVKEQLSAGTYEADWNADNFSSGVYYYKLIAGDYTETKKMVLMK